VLRHCVDGNEAAAAVAYALSDVIAVYPITPASPMGELADEWAASERPNLWGDVPRVVEMQSEGGAAGALHGGLQAGALATTFTASQGLLLMLPNMFKIAGELTPAVIHVAARTIATHALSIFGDHSDVMAARTTGWGMLASASVQEAQDLAAVAHAATLESRVPFVHFFDGFRTSHEISDIVALDGEILRGLIDEASVLAHRRRGLSPERPVLRGSAQNPDVFFQAREAANPFYAAAPGVVQGVMDRLAERTGRAYRLVEYVGHPEADRVIVLMGSGAGAVGEAVEELGRRGERVGLLKIRLFRPFPAAALTAALPASVRAIAVLDRTKEPGALGEPLYQDVLTALADPPGEAWGGTESSDRGQVWLPLVVGGRYGLSSKEFTPQMAAGVFAELGRAKPKRSFTVGIVDDVTGTSIAPDPTLVVPRPAGTVQAVFYGLGSDGTVGANKNTVKIVGDRAGLHVQGYFVYDSKKSGAVTVSHLRFSAEPIRSTYLIDEADFVACHQFGFLERRDVLKLARPGATVLLNSPFPADQVWDRLPVEAQEAIVAKGLRLHVIDAYAVARDVGLGARINTVMQPCFFALSGILPRDQAIAAIKDAIVGTYGRRGEAVVTRNLAAVDRALDALQEVVTGRRVTATRRRPPVVPPEAPDFVQRVTARMLADEGDLLPVSALPVDGTFPVGTARWEKRALAQEIPVWDPDICIDCGKCTIVCPHAAIRMKVFEPAALDGAPGSFASKEFRSRRTGGSDQRHPRELPGYLLSIQVAPDDCTGCGVCVDVCPVTSKQVASHKALNMEPVADRARERDNFSFFLDIRESDGAWLPLNTVKGSQVREPLFEFSGACAGCGETPYLKLLTQLFGDRIVVANATGCSSIYGGNLPTTPWSANRDGRGPAWANSLFEDNAEFGLGIRLGLQQQTAAARSLLAALAPSVGTALATAILDAAQADEGGIAAQRQRVGELKARLAELDGGDAARLLALADALVDSSVWIVGGDGWAHDIGYGGLDHVLASGENVNVLVLDTEAYSNTGGQASKATPRAAVAKFATAGKPTPKKDLGLLAMQYGNVYVGQVALGASEVQTVRTLLEAAAWPGPSLVLAYSTCIAHGIDMATSMTHQRDAVRSGHWPLYRFNPGAGEHARPFKLDSKPPSIPLADFVATEGRFAMLARSDPERAAQLLAMAQADVDERIRYYEQLAGVERSAPDRPEPSDALGAGEEQR
jgi:pyruvate-ferredoxin/flavodoxin oxidoreductase